VIDNGVQNAMPVIRQAIATLQFPTPKKPVIFDMIKQKETKMNSYALLDQLLAELVFHELKPYIVMN
jgi:hypothetical protein